MFKLRLWKSSTGLNQRCQGIFDYLYRLAPRLARFSNQKIHVLLQIWEKISLFRTKHYLSAINVLQTKYEYIHIFLWMIVGTNLNFVIKGIFEIFSESIKNRWKVWLVCGSGSSIYHNSWYRGQYFVPVLWQLFATH